MRSVTVIVAARHAASWVAQCLTSIASQRLPSGWRLQIRLGVDACPSTLTAAVQLPLAGLQVYYFAHHVGPYVIFNSLAWLERSDLLVRFDADDIMLDGYLNEQIALIRSPSLVQIVQTWSIYVDNHLQPLSAEIANGTRTNPDGRRNAASDGQFVMTYPVFERLGSFRAWWCHADSDFLRRAAWAGIPRDFVTQHLYLRRIHPTSLSQADFTGYRSQGRDFYRLQIAEAEHRYERGQPAECVGPAVAPHIRCTTGWRAPESLSPTARWLP